MRFGVVGCSIGRKVLMKTSVGRMGGEIRQGCKGGIKVYVGRFGFWYVYSEG